MSPSIAAMILAAGAATRMGRPKQLLDWGGRPLLRVVAEHALAAHVDRVVAVLGAASEQVATALAGLPIEIVLNPGYAQGQSSSLHAGVRALGRDVDAALVLLGDQPFVTPPIIDRLIGAWRAGGAAIVAPSYRGLRGNPVLFAQAIFPELLAISGDQGARAILSADRARVQTVEFDDERPLLDIDTFDEYTRLQPARPADA